MPKDLALKVAEAIPDDVNKGIVRIDSTFMRELEVRPGDIIEIEGGRKTAAIIDRAYPGDIGLNIIRMDPMTRKNAKTSIGELIKVRQVKFEPAKKVVVAPAREGIVVRASPNIFKQGLLGRVVVKGDLISLGGTRRRRSAMSSSPLFEEIFSVMEEGMMGGFGFGDLKFVVAETSPKNTVVITEATEVVLNPEAVVLKEEEILGVAYEDIGGLEDEIKKIREMVELPLKHPEIFERLGVEPPKGVLLHGPPGTGKTLLAKAVANETNAHFICINGPEIVSKFYGESESNIRKKFEEAEKNAPSILFIDEIDAIATKREETRGEVERRIVAQLLTLMDGLKSRGRVVVIGATNAPNLLDPALRRPGRFDRELEIGVPDKDGRLTILKIHTRSMPMSEDVDLKEIAGITYGFVGADLAALAKEAAMIVLKRVIPDLKYEADEAIPKEVLEKLLITKDDFKEALKIVRPSALREVLIEVPNVHWSDVGGLDKIKQELKEAVEWPLKHPDAFKRLGVKPPKGILLYGAPGTGKTLLAKAIATESEANFISVKGPELLCLSGETPIFTNFCGVRPIEQFYKNAYEISKLEKQTNNLEVRKLTKPIFSYAVDKRGKIVKTKIQRIHKLFVEDAYTLRLADNNELTVSKNQPLLVYRDDELVWIKSEDLRKDDFVAKPSYLPSFDTKINLKLPKYEFLKLVKEDENVWHVKINTTKTITKLPKKLTPELSEFLGWFVAEGNISKEGVSICNMNKERREKIKTLFTQFIEENRIRAYEDKIICYSTPLVKYLEEIFETVLGKKKSHNITVPPLLTKSSKENIISFLRGAYLGDGHFDNQKIEYGSRSKNLVEGMSYLLTILGIKFKYWKRKDSEYMLTTSGKKEIAKCRNLLFGESNSTEVRQYYNARYELPFISNLLKITKKELNLTYSKEIPEGLFEGVISGRRKAGLIRLQRMMGYVDKYATNKFRKENVYRTLKLLSSGILSWTKIISRTRAEPCWMYDVETKHSAFIGGFAPLLLHNSKWVGESEKAVREVFKKARQTAPTIIFFDEIDSLAPRRGASSDSHVTERVVNQILTEIDGLESMQDILIIGATNRPDIVDTALLRPGRFDRVILTTVPDEKTRLEILKVHTKGMPIKNVKLDELASKTHGYVGADLEAVCREAAILALREDINAKEIDHKHFFDALKKVHPSVSKEVEKAYESLEEHFTSAKGKEMAEEKPNYFG